GIPAVSIGQAVPECRCINHHIEGLAPGTNVGRSRALLDLAYSSLIMPQEVPHGHLLNGGQRVNHNALVPGISFVEGPEDVVKLRDRRGSRDNDVLCVVCSLERSHAFLTSEVDEECFAQAGNSGCKSGFTGTLWPV